MRLLASFLVLLLAGCSGEDLSSKKTLFDDDHEIPPHWPSGPGDTAVKIQERLEILESNSEERVAIEKELGDLVSWAAEIAADTDLTEQEWNPIYDVSEQIRKQLRNQNWPEKNRPKLEELCGLLLTAEQVLAERREENRFRVPESES